MELTGEEAETLVTETREKVAAQVAAGSVVLLNPYRPETGMGRGTPRSAW